jgi:hypothetical protein
VITKVRLAAAHEGVAELVVSLTYINGGESDIALDQATGARLMRRVGAIKMEDLIGQGWEHIRDALTDTYNGLEKEDTCSI